MLTCGCATAAPGSSSQPARAMRRRGNLDMRGIPRSFRIVISCCRRSRMENDMRICFARKPADPRGGIVGRLGAAAVALTLTLLWAAPDRATAGVAAACDSIPPLNSLEMTQPLNLGQLKQ